MRKLLKRHSPMTPMPSKINSKKTMERLLSITKTLINQQSTALGQLQSVAPTLRQKYANSLITNPTDQMALIAQARQAPLMDYSNAVNLLSARGNKYQDILGKALGGYQTSANQANTIAENLWRLYQDALQQDQFNAQLRASRTPHQLVQALKIY